MKKQTGITLIALVITIIILIILAGVSINLVVGDNGIITTAKRAKEEMTISEGKEKIELALLDINTERISNGNSCNLDYVSEKIDGKVKNVKIEGIKGSPVVKIYLSYKDYMYKITSDLKVEYIGNINIAEEPELEIVRDVTETGVDKVNLTIKASVEEGEISEIVKPDGSIVYAEETTYEIASNGSYTFKAVTEKGIIEEKTIEIQSIKDNEAIEITTASSSTGEDETVECSHIYEIKYDDTNHWKQCILCNKKMDVVSHTLVTIGEAGCSANLGKQTQYCSDGCGYKITLPKVAHSSNIIEQAPADYVHRYRCSVCNNAIKIEICKNENGEKLGCSTGKIGTCANCGYTYANANHGVIREGFCSGCRKKFYNVTKKREIVDETTTKYTWHYEVIEEGFKIVTNKPSYMILNASPSAELIYSNVTINDDGSVDVVKTFKAKHTSIIKADVASVLSYSYNGYTRSIIDYQSTSLSPDNYAPTVQSITATGADSTTEFSRSATITAKFEETWDSIVEMALYDSDGTVISNWSAASKDGTTFTKKFNVVAETATSKELTVKAKDRCGNIGEGKVTIGKIDTKAPTLVSTTAYNTDWSILKQIKIEATDEGSGNVQIGLGSEENYQLGQLDNNKYYREYKLTGDVYEDIVRIVYLKDAVGNITTKRITIGKLDKTSPTITNIIKNEKTITIEANDINTKLNKEGSGIKGYAISKTKEVPADNGFQTSNKFTVEETGTYYIWAKDNAGNLSQTKQIEIN